MKLWQKDYKLNKEVEKFTVGNDYLLDKNLVKYDVYGSIAHATMLNKIGILTREELNKLKKALIGILKLNESNNFEIKLEDEDVHTAIENYLTKKLGNIGKKIHTARSRNDQVLVDLRLYSKEKILEVEKELVNLLYTIIYFAGKNKNVPMPGYTHTRKAMSSSAGLLFGAYAESLLDDFELLETAYKLTNQNPLGSAAGYGISLNVDRELTTKLLGFEKVQNNVLYVQNSRGKIESIIVFALSKIMEDLAKISNDLIIFNMEELGFFQLPDEFTTGSSMLPHKKNPDVLELIRAKSSIVDSYLFQINGIIKKIPSGYNRDLQLIKEPLMQGFEIALSSINVMSLLIKELKVNKDNCIKACTNEIFAADDVINLVKTGVPLRDAYKQVAKNPENLPKIDAIANIISKKHIGATGNLGLDKLKQKIKSINAGIDSEIKKFNSKIKVLLR
ncbi:argininosuccinate lyase [Candidatus Woesearchaeota archaeon]|nr:argininosuccinate lyase [Candidatus Woesearchaeota archaeon]